MTFLRRWWFWLVAVLLVLMFLAIIYTFVGRNDGLEKRPLSDVIAEAEAGRVAEIHVDDTKVTVTLRDGTEFRSEKERDTSMLEVLQDADVAVGGSDGLVLEVEGGGWGVWIGIIISLLPTLMFAALILAVGWFAFARRKA